MLANDSMWSNPVNVVVTSPFFARCFPQRKHMGFQCGLAHISAVLNPGEAGSQ